MPVQPPITEPELRDWLADAGLAIDDATAARLLVRLQPMGARLRGATLAQLESALRGHALAAGWKPTGAPSLAYQGAARAESAIPRVAVPAFPVAIEIPDSAPLIRRGNWGKRIVLLYLAAVMGFFALASLASNTRASSLLFVAIGLGLLYVAVTGQGLSGSEQRAAPLSWSDRAANAVLFFSGGGIVMGSLGLFILGVGVVNGDARHFPPRYLLSPLVMIGSGLAVRRAVRYWREHQ